MIPFSDTVSVYADASKFFVDLLASHFGFKIGSKIPPDFSLYFWIFHRTFTISWLKLSFLPQGVTLTRMTKPNGPKKPCVFFANPEPPHRLISHMYSVSILFLKNVLKTDFFEIFWIFFEFFWKIIKIFTCPSLIKKPDTKKKAAHSKNAFWPSKNEFWPFKNPKIMLENRFLSAKMHFY